MSDAQANLEAIVVGIGAFVFLVAAPWVLSRPVIRRWIWGRGVDDE